MTVLCYNYHRIRGCEMEKKVTPESNPEEKVTGLQSTTIGLLKKPKERKTTLIVFTVLALFIALVIFLPDISKLLGTVDAELLGDGVSSSRKVLVDNNKDFFVISEESKIFLDNHQFTGFKIDEEEQVLMYKVTNNSDKRTSISNIGWFITFYNENKELVDFRPIDTQLLKPDTEMELDVNLKESYSTPLKYLKIGVVKEEEYPNIDLNSDFYGDEYLACSLGNLKYTYYFTEDKVSKINVYYSATKASLPETYEIIYQTYKLEYNNYKDEPNFTPTFIDNFTGFVFQTDISLANGNYTNLDKNYLSSNTTPKEVNFLMESRGFDCK